MYAGNNEGEVFVYSVKNMDKAFRNDPEEPMLKAKLKLKNYIQTRQKYVVRDALCIDGEGKTIVTTSEANKINVWKPKELGQMQQAGALVKK